MHSPEESRYGCPRCGGEDIYSIETVYRSYRVLAWEDGIAADFDERDDYDGEHLHLECVGCGATFQEPVSLQE